MLALVWKVKGIITAILTPLTRNGDLCVDCLKELIEFQLSNGISGLFIMGTYGEGLLLSQKVRKKMLEKTIEFVPTKTITLPHVGAADPETAYSLAKYAKDLGYQAVSSIGPVYYKPSIKGLINYFNYLAKADLEIIIYNNVGRLKYNITPNVFEKITCNVPAVTGIKDTSYLAEQLLEYVSKFKNKYFIAGAGDSMIYYTFSIGADAHICGISNAFPEVAVKLYKAYLENDVEKAIKLQSIANSIRTMSKKFSTESPEVMREILKIRGINAGYPLKIIGGLEQKEKKKLRTLTKHYLKAIEEV